MENTNPMGIIIKEKRKNLGLTQLELAQQLGVSDKAVSKWERCESLPDITLVPKIAQQLGVSIEYLMTGKAHVEEKDCTARQQAKTDEEKENAQTLYHSAMVMHSKVNTKYTVCICMLFFVAISGLFGTGLFVYWDLREVVYATASIALFAVFYMSCRTNCAMLESFGAKYTGGAGTVAALVAAANVLMLTFIGERINDNIPLIASLLEWADIYKCEGVMSVKSGHEWLILLLVLFVAAVVNLYMSKDRNYFDKNVAAVFAGGIVMSAAHRWFYGFIAGYIASEKQYLYTFYLEKPNAIRVVGNIEKYTLIYLAALVVFGIAVGFVFSKGKKQKAATMLAMAAAGGYSGLSAGQFLTYEAVYGSSFAQLADCGMSGIVVIAAMLPHIVMILNRWMKGK